MLDVVERKQPVVSLAVDTQAARGHLPPLGLSVLQAALDASTLSKLALKTILEDAGILGAALQLKDGLSVTFAEDCQSDDKAQRLSASLHRDTGPELVKLLSAALGTPVEMLDAPAGTPQNPSGGRPSPFGSGGPPGRIAGMRGSAVPPPPRPGVMGAGAVRPSGPVSPAFGRRGNLPEQESTDPARPKPGATLRVEIQQPALVLLTINLTDPGANHRLMSGSIRQAVLEQKGYLDMVGGQPRIHELGDAVIKYTESHAGQFPRGTIERKIPPTRAGRPYEPKQRISWFAELLPYLGSEQAFLSNGIDREKSWNDPANLAAAATLVPQFLNPNYPPHTWWVRYPTIMQPTAATHYVGIAGIGADAAEYSANDPATAKKLGVFGYDRTTRVQDITDGVSNTILMAQVPPTYKRPWMAGGGSTVEGVLEKDSVRPFVSPQPDGKRGTLVVMADGSVRFVAENVKDEIFKALCTIKGGETDFILDRDAVPVPRPESEADVPPPVQKPAAATCCQSGPGRMEGVYVQRRGLHGVIPRRSPRDEASDQNAHRRSAVAHGWGEAAGPERDVRGDVPRPARGCNPTTWSCRPFSGRHSAAGGSDGPRSEGHGRAQEVHAGWPPGPGIYPRKARQWVLDREGLFGQEAALPGDGCGFQRTGLFQGSATVPRFVPPGGQVISKRLPAACGLALSRKRQRRLFHVEIDS